MFINQDFYIELLVPTYRTVNLVLFVNETCYKMRRVREPPLMTSDFRVGR